MPIYEYECSSCGQRFELRRAMSDSDSDIECPRCGAKSPRRVFSVFGTGSTGGGPSGAECAPGRPT